VKLAVKATQAGATGYFTNHYSPGQPERLNTRLTIPDISEDCAMEKRPDFALRTGKTCETQNTSNTEY
jgi:hypothetical protein